MADAPAVIGGDGVCTLRRRDNAPAIGVDRKALQPLAQSGDRQRPAYRVRD